MFEREALMKKREIVIETSHKNTDADKRQNSSNQKSKTHPRKKKVVISVILAIVLLLGASTVYVLGWINKMAGTQFGGGNANINPNTEYKYYVDVPGRNAVLMLGLDADGANTDTIMLAVLDSNRKMIDLMSIPRDTKVANPNGKGGFVRINSVYAGWDLNELKNTITEITGIPIGKYMIVNFKAFRNAVDILGGVDFYVPRRLKYDDSAQNLHIDLYEGMQKLNGNKAEQLVRSRNNYDEADIKRTEVQRDFIKEMVKQHAKIENIFKLDKIFSDVMPHIASDLSYKEAYDYANVFASVPEENIRVHIFPGAVNDYQAEGISWYLYHTKEMDELAYDIYWFDVQGKTRLYSTQLPSYTRTSAPSSTYVPKPSPTQRPTSTPSDDETPNTSIKPSSSPATSTRPSSSVSPKPSQTPGGATTSTPTVSPTQKPTPTDENETPKPPDGI